MKDEFDKWTPLDFRGWDPNWIALHWILIQKCCYLSYCECEHKPNKFLPIQHSMHQTLCWIAKLYVFNSNIIWYELLW
jgi:hypothetical protein